ncbi:MULTISPECIES: cytochrome ubiquinol oxidase subunit I [Brevibacterium]|uniref:Cytochrome bd-I ubiquinol oxidase subunit 1 apoprotein n=1 Tax=Brevibacterium antiquum CNRZ 918 TaxID=1255637 RepID=A0A2H1HL80_9MICO|nr:MULTISPECIES: cytochrome ubiquinol oxidase subunit I [Brevibacterium]SMX63626.1 cytochrome bd-I ubiquinol oxidase subunit 1 apoprotein [Brevibacterium antiquum CNRZ 918]HCG57529.1 cytochrome ubiquinol oxidase subunit I [Brevibacterium sp.]
MDLDPVLIGRWQFGITTVYHFWMVPLTLGLGMLVAILQTMYHRTGNEMYLRSTKFFGKLFLINFIMGVATGLVQEFQFGMAWSEYSRFVGDVFGAPLALEALLAFFLESTFLGLWIFGWGRLPRAVHLGSLWCAVIGSWISAYFIIVANSWMQHPVGVELVDGQAVMTDVWAVMTNNTAIAAYTHTLCGALAVGGSFLLGISWYHLYRRRKDGIDAIGPDGKVLVGSAPDVPGRDAIDHQVWIRSLRIGAVVGIVAFLGVAITGDIQSKLMFEQQPMKMASAEAACHDGTEFSVLTIGDPSSNDCDGVENVFEIPGLLSFLAKGDFNTPVHGVTTLLPDYQDKYGTHLPEDERYGQHSGEKIDYQPIMIVTYWGFRMMIGFGMIAAGVSALGLWLTRKGTVPASPWLMRGALLSVTAPFIANSAGWIFTEMGRQPFVVAPNPAQLDGVYMFTQAALSPQLTPAMLLFSLISLSLVYGILMVVELRLLIVYIRGGVASAMPEVTKTNHTPRITNDEDDVLSFAY